MRLGGSRLEEVTEAGTERAVVDGAADLEQKVGPAPGPAHLLRLGHAPVDQEVGRALGERRPNPQAGRVPGGVVDQPGALASQVAVDRVQRPLQLASGLAFEGGQERAGPLDGDPGVLGLAIPSPPAQALDLGGDRRLRLLPIRRVSRQAGRRLPGMLEAHGKMSGSRASLPKPSPLRTGRDVE